jgi:hypothetical protein
VAVSEHTIFAGQSFPSAEGDVLDGHASQVPSVKSLELELQVSGAQLFPSLEAFE